MLNGDESFQPVEKLAIRMNRSLDIYHYNSELT